MPFRNLRSFLDFLDTKGDLLRVKTEVDPILEITEIAERVVKKGGPALLFENVKGSRFPVAVNMLGAERRIAWALGRSPAAVGKELESLAHAAMPPSLPKLWGQRGSLKRVLGMKPAAVSRPPVFRNVIQPANLDLLPVCQSWPKDGGRFITFPLVITKSPQDGRQNMGVYRMHVYNGRETGMHWQIGKGGGYHYLEAERKGQDLPVAVTVGADPILLLCGVLPLPEGLDEMSFAGFLRGEATRTARTEAGLSVPAEADFVLEGRVPLRTRRLEGPYGDHFGHYSLAADFPVFEIDRIWHRPDAVFPVAVVGKPPQEDGVIGDTVQEMLLPLLKIMHPEVTDLWAYMEAGFHNLIVASVRQRFAKEAVKTGLWILGEGQLSLSKCVVLVDPDVNARKFTDVLRAIRDHFDPQDDFILLPGTSQDTLDFTSFQMNLGSKMIIDATRGSGSPRPRAAVRINLDALKKMDGRIRDCRVIEDALLVVQIDGNGSSAGREILEKMLSFPGLETVPIAAAVSPDVPMDDPILLVWGLFTRFDCARDVFFQKTRLAGARAVPEGTLLIDATWKNGYPEPLEMNRDVVETVNRRWREYGFEN